MRLFYVFCIGVLRYTHFAVTFKLELLSLLLSFHENHYIKFEIHRYTWYRTILKSTTILQSIGLNTNNKLFKLVLNCCYHSRKIFIMSFNVFFPLDKFRIIPSKWKIRMKYVLFQERIVFLSWIIFVFQADCVFSLIETFYIFFFFLHHSCASTTKIYILIIARDNRRIIYLYILFNTPWSFLLNILHCIRISARDD